MKNCKPLIGCDSFLLERMLTPWLEELRITTYSDYFLLTRYVRSFNGANVSSAIHLGLLKHKKSNYSTKQVFNMLNEYPKFKTIIICLTHLSLYCI